MMKKIYIPVVLFFGIALAGCIKQPVPVAQQSANQQAQEMQDIAQAIQAGKSAICTIKNDETSMDMSIKGKKFKMSAVVKVPGEKEGEMVERKAFSVSDEKYMYTWTDMSAQGVKFMIPSEEMIKAEPEKYGAYEDAVPKLGTQEDFNELRGQGYSVDCKEAAVADTEFVAPLDITFTEMNLTDIAQ